MKWRLGGLLAGIALLIGLASPAAHAQTTSSRPMVNLLAMGDWGRNNAQQRKVAQNMAQYVRSSGHTYQAMILLGDNCYIKLTGHRETLWDEMFETMYDPKTLDFPFYAALGNHDYSNGAVAFELNYSKEHPNSRWRMPAKYYRIELPASRPLVTVLVLDSCKGQMKPDEWKTETAWIKSELARPRTTPWLICAAHHPLFSNGDHGDDRVLRRVWGSMFKKYGVDFYLCGHDHDIQHLEIPGWPISFVLAGGGGARIRPMRVDRRGPFSKSTFGFADFQFTPEIAKCRLVSGNGKVIHEFSRTPNKKVTITFTTPSDVAIARTLKSTRPNLTSGATSRPAAVN